MSTFTKHRHHFYKRDRVSFSIITLIFLAIITFTPSPSSANPTPLKLLTLPPIPSPEALQSFQEELPTPISLKGSQPNSNSNFNLEKNICEAVPDRIFFCNCDSYERPVDVACFATVNSSNPLHPDWLDFAAQSPVLSTSVTAFKLTAFNGHTFSYLPLTAINHLRPSLVKLTVSGLGLRTLATNAISGFTELEEVDFQGCTSLALEEERPFGSLPKLHKLIINDANIGTLRRLFGSVPILEEVYIAKSKIRSIQVEGEGEGVDGAFTGMESCQYLDLDQNAIEEVSQATFRGLRNLKELQLNWNAIRHLAAGTFAEMPLLTEIELSHNQIESVDPAAFAGLPRLQSLKLEYNRLREFPAAGLFSANRQLTVVDIAFNFFTTVSWTVFHQPAASGGNRYIRFRIQGNEIQCTCSIAWMSKALKFYDSIVEQELQTVDCKYPEADPQQILPFIRSSPPDRRPKSIYAFITHPEVASGCKLPTALLQAEKTSATEEEEERKRKLKAGGGDNQNSENDYDDANDNEQAKKTISEMNGNEVGVLVAGGVEGEQSSIQPVTTPKVTRVFENEGGSSGVHKSPHDSSAVLKDTNDKSTNQLNQAQFGAGSAAPPRTTAVSAFALTVLLLFVSFLSFVR